MLSPVLEQELHQHLEVLPVHQQRRVLNFARALAAAQTQSVPGQTLLSFAGTIESPDLATMSQAAEEECEHINLQGW